MRIPAWVLWRMLIAIISAVSDSVIRAISSRPASTQRSPGDAVEQRRDALLVGAAVADDQHVLVERVVEVCRATRR